MWINPVAIAAFILTLIGTLLVNLAMFLPLWWVGVSPRGTIIYFGMWILLECDTDGECTYQHPSQIEGGKEFLFICKVFMCIAVALCLLGLVLHIIYIPLRKVAIRSVAIYCLGAAGLFVLLAFFIFLGKHRLLIDRLKSFTIGWSFGLAVLGSVVCLVASGLTALATIKKAQRHEDEERLDINPDHQMAGFVGPS